MRAGRSAAGASTYLVGDVPAIELARPPAPVRDQLARELGARPIMPSDGRDAPGPVLRIAFAEPVGRVGDLTVLGGTGGAGFGFDRHDAYLLDDHGRPIRLELRAPEGDGRGAAVALTGHPGVRRIPHLAALLGVAVLDRDRVLLHAASMIVDGRGIIVPGWQSAGKSELLLGFMALRREGVDVRYLGDEWTLVGPGPTMAGLASHPQLWGWQVAQLPELARRLPRRARLRLRVIALARQATRAGQAAIAGDADRAPGRLLRDLEGWLSNADRAQVSPTRLFGPAEPAGGRPIEHLLFPTVGFDGRTTVRPIDPRLVADRMVGAQAYERRALDALRAQLGFAFPERRWAQLEAAGDREREILRSAFAGLPAHEVRHPYPTDLESMARQAWRAIAGT